MKDRSLEELRDELEALAQEITDRFIGKDEYLGAKFPRGYICRLNDFRNRWPYLEKEHRRIVSQAFQLIDVNVWQMNVWEIGLSAGSIWQWHCTLPVIAVIETLLYEFGLQQGWIVPEAKFKKVIDTLGSKGIYRQALKNKLHAWREYRNEIHLYLKQKVEIYEGVPAKYNDCMQTLEDVEDMLLAYWEKGRT